MQNESYEERNALLAERLVHILPEELPAFPERERDKLILYGMAPLYGRFARDAVLIAAVGRCACPRLYFFARNPYKSSSERTRAVL